MAHAKGIRLKKKYGQHFLRDPQYVYHMIEAVNIDEQSSIFEIGPGDGFLTKNILQTKCARLWSFEIDEDWFKYLKKEISDSRFTVYHDNFLDIDFSMFESNQPWIVLANLPYNVTFPILHAFQQHRGLLKEGVVMVQEEVAQKIVKKTGRGFGLPSLFFQRYFEWKLLDKVPPSAFHPKPKVFSRLLYFKPRTQIEEIPNEEAFWKFIAICFKQPRRTLQNNLRQVHFDLEKIPKEFLSMRAQQLQMSDFLALWQQLQ